MFRLAIEISAHILDSYNCWVIEGDGLGSGQDEIFGYLYTELL